MDKLFLDSDIVLDFLLDRKPFSEAATIVMSMGDLGKVKLYSSGLVFSNCYYVLRKFSGHQKVIDSLTSLASFIEIVPVNHKVVHQALHSPFKDFEDAIQNAAAINAGVSILLTRNGKDFKHSELSVMAPEEYLSAYPG